MALRQGPFWGPAHSTLALGTIRNTISWIYLWENGQPNPTKDDDLQLSFILHQQFQAFKNANPKEKHQKSHPHLRYCQNCKEEFYRAATCYIATHHSCLFLCHAFVLTSKSSSKRNEEPKYFASKTFDSSTMVGLSTTTIPPLNTPTASTSLLKNRKRQKE